MLVRLISHKSVCDHCLEFSSNCIVRTDSSLFPWQLFDQRVGNLDVDSPDFENLIETCDHVSYSSSIFTYCFPIRDNQCSVAYEEMLLG